MAEEKIIIQKKFLSLEEAAEYLNYSKSSMYKKAENNEIPYYKPSGKVYFKIEDLDNYVEQSRVSSNEEVELEVEQYM